MWSARCAASALGGSWVDDLSPIGPADWNYERAAHLIERAGFGATPKEIERLAAMTPEERCLDAPGLAVDDELEDLRHAVLRCHGPRRGPSNRD